MHRLLSSAGLWPTLVSILALFVHPLLFCLFSFLLHLFLLLPVDSCLSIYLFWRWEDFWDCVHTLFTGSSCLPVLSPPPRCLLPVCVFSLSFSSSDHPASTPDSSFPSSQRVSTCLSSSWSQAPSVVLSWRAGMIQHACFVLSTKSSKPLKNAHLCCYTLKCPLIAKPHSWTVSSWTTLIMHLSWRWCWLYRGHRALACILAWYHVCSHHVNI